MNRLALIAASACAVLAAGCGDNIEVCNLEEVGTICTVAGSGEFGYDIDADFVAYPALETKFSLPQDTLTAPDGTILILDWNNHRLRRLTSDGMIERVAGQGELGGTLDNPALNDFNHPTNLIFDETGENIIIAAWHNSKVRRIDLATGEVVDSCGDGKRAYFGDGGAALTSSLDLPASIALDSQGRLTIMDQANQVLRRIDEAGNIQLLAGHCVIDAPAPDGPGACPDGVEPVQCPPGPNGPSGKFTCSGTNEFCSKPCTPGYNGDQVLAADMRMAQPFGQTASPAGRIAYDRDGNLFFADTGNQLIRMIDTDGIVHNIAGTPPVDGETQSGYAGDGGPATDALLNFPVDIALADDGTLFFTDVINHCIRAIDPDGNIDTVVGVCGEKGFDGDGGPADQALLKQAFGVEWVDGRLIIADTGNNRIRTVLLP